jgi:hypothetical protein
LRYLRFHLSGTRFEDYQKARRFQKEDPSYDRDRTRDNVVHGLRGLHGSLSGGGYQHQTGIQCRVLLPETISETGVDSAEEILTKTKGENAIEDYDRDASDACLKLFREKGYQLT